jgi:hypothetical protein
MLHRDVSPNKKAISSDARFHPLLLAERTVIALLKHQPRKATPETPPSPQDLRHVVRHLVEPHPNSLLLRLHTKTWESHRP